MDDKKFGSFTETLLDILAIILIIVAICNFVINMDSENLLYNISTISPLLAMGGMLLGISKLIVIFKSNNKYLKDMNNIIVQKSEDELKEKQRQILDKIKK